MNLQSYGEGRGLMDYHRGMLGDTTRVDAYRRAISEVVKEGDVVVDLGCGTGILSFFACAAGARRVHAIEQGPAVELAKVLARHNGFDDRIVFHRALSMDVQLPEEADVIVTETMWNFGLGEGILGSVIDARDRFLRADGSIVPRHLELQCAPIQNEALYDRVIEFWNRDLDGVHVSPLRQFAVSNVYVQTLTEDDCLAEPASLGRIAMSEVKDVDIEMKGAVRIARDGVLHGLGGWFRADLSENTVLSNAPPRRTPSWEHVFLPVERAVDVREGESVNIGVRTINNGSHWKWDVERTDGAAGAQSARSSQATLFGLPLSREELDKRTSDYEPSLSRRAEAALFVLRSFDGKTTLGEIEKEVLARYSELFGPERNPANFVRELAAAYAR